jgi:multidrug efflux pump subunit AcrA (membrane-fusion protein)
MAVGLFVDAELEGRELTQVVQIPSKGLRPGDQIYVVDASGQLDIRTVSVASSNARTTIISDGLRPGERVVVSTLRNPVSGMRVETIDDDRLAAAGA